MSGSASLTLEQGILQHTLGIAAMAFPAQVYVALCAASLPPSESIPGVEAFGGGYARVAATFALLASPTNIAANTASVEFPLATADWGSLGYFEIWSAQTGGSRLYWGGLVDPATGAATALDVSAGDIVRFSAGTLAIEAVPVTATASAGVSSFNTRTGVVLLSNSDVVGVLPPSANPPLMDGVAAVGTSATWARGDHVHPSDAGIAANAAAAGHNIGRNLLHNPLFNVAQRGAGPWTSNNYTADRWQLYTNLDTGINVSISPMAPGGMPLDEGCAAVLVNTFTGNAGAAAQTVIFQYIENVRRLSNRTVTVSFYAQASATQKLGVSIDQNFGTGGSPSAQVAGVGQAVTLSTTWTRYNLTFTLASISGKTLGTTSANHNTGLNFWYSSGATNATRAGNIGVQSGTINIWGVQLEVGSVATPLEKPDPRYDLANCQRFYFSSNMLAAGYNVAGGQLFIPQFLPVSMRAVPTVTTSGVATTNCALTSVGGSGVTWCQATITITAAGNGYAVYTLNASADL